MVVVMKKVSENYVFNAKVAKKMWPGAIVLDSTMGGAMEKLDPVFPLGKIKISVEKWVESHSIMGIWEGLKLFSKKNEVDLSYLKDLKKLGKERGCKSYGKMIGIKWGDDIIEGEENLKEFFSRLYKDVIGERFKGVIEKLKEINGNKTVVLLDYSEGNEKYPVSHVELIKELVES